MATLTEGSLAHAETGSTAYWTSVIAVPRHQAVGIARSMSRLVRTTALSKAQAPAGVAFGSQPAGLEQRRVADPRQPPDDFLFLDGAERPAGRPGSSSDASGRSDPARNSEIAS